MRRFGVPAALLLATAALAGCGGDNGAGVEATGTEPSLEAADAYVEQVRASAGTVRSSADRLAAGATTAELEGIVAELEQAVRRVEQATPPYDLLPEHQRLTQAVWDAVDAGHGAAAEVGELAAADLAPVTSALAEAVEALGDMEEKGYEVRRRT